MSEGAPAGLIATVVYSASVLAWLATAIYFVQRRRFAPLLVKVLLSVSIAGTLLQAALYEPGDDVVKAIVRPLVIDLSWLAYFSLSQRVKETFTR